MCKPPADDDGVVALLPLGPYRARSASDVGSFERRDFGLPVAAEHDVGPATGHVGRNRHDTGSAGLRDDLGLAFVLLRVQHAVRNLALVEFARQSFGRFDRGGADEHGATFRDAFVDVFDDRVVLLVDRQIHEIVGVVAHHRPVGRNDHHRRAHRSGETRTLRYPRFRSFRTSLLYMRK